MLRKQKYLGNILLARIAAEASLLIITKLVHQSKRFSYAAFRHLVKFYQRFWIDFSRISDYITTIDQGQVRSLLITETEHNIQLT